MIKFYCSILWYVIPYALMTMICYWVRGSVETVNDRAAIAFLPLMPMVVWLMISEVEKVRPNTLRYVGRD